MSPMGGKRRTVIVAHPDFDKLGGAGVKEAKDFAMTLLDGQKQMIEMAEKSGAPANEIAKVKAYVKTFQIVIRSIDDEII